MGHLSAPNTPEGLIRLHEFGARFFPRRGAVEGAGNHFIAAFVAELLAGSEFVFSIPASLTSQYRARRGRKKSDVIDAENVARALLANHKLPELHAVDHQRELQELTRTQRRLSEQLKASRAAFTRAYGGIPSAGSTSARHLYPRGSIESPATTNPTPGLQPKCQDC